MSVHVPEGHKFFYSIWSYMGHVNLAFVRLEYKFRAPLTSVYADVTQVSSTLFVMVAK